MVDGFNMVSQGHQSCLEGSGNHLDGECVEGGTGQVGESTGGRWRCRTPRRHSHCSKDSLPSAFPHPNDCALGDHVSGNCPSSGFGRPPQKCIQPAKALPLKVRSGDQAHCPTRWKCSSSGPTLSPLRQHLRVKISRGFAHRSEFEKHGSKDKRLSPGWQGRGLESWDHFPLCPRGSQTLPARATTS